MKIKILGPGCPNCQRMEEMAAKALNELNAKAEIEHIKDMKEISKYVMVTPGLVVNEKVKHEGKPLPTPEKVKELIKEEI
ncbi:MAG TPA: thioredoxin family protein [Nitrospinota bacterium]|nr:thioredoxin family protein [Nitrospinota bacterium]